MTSPIETRELGCRCIMFIINSAKAQADFICEVLFEAIINLECLSDPKLHSQPEVTIREH